MPNAWPTVPGYRVDPLAGRTTVSGWFGSTVIWYCWNSGWVWGSVPFTVKVDAGSTPGAAGVPLIVAPDPVKVAGRDRPAGSAPAAMLSVPPTLWLVVSC